MPTSITLPTIQERALAYFKERGHIDVVELARSLGIDVFLEENGKRFDAKVVFNAESDKYEIAVNKDHPYTRQRFSIAHELAHLVLHPGDIKKQGAINRARYGTTNYDTKEQQADDLAAQILMPEVPLREQLQSVTEINDNIVRHLAQEFRVSPITVIFRLRALGYAVPYISFS